MSSNQWIEWNGRSQPVSDDTVVEIKFRDGDTQTHPASFYRWQHARNMKDKASHLESLDIIAYRMIPETKDWKADFYKDCVNGFKRIDPNFDYKEAQQIENKRLTDLMEKLALSPKAPVLADNFSLEYKLNPDEFPEKEPKKQTLLEYVHENYPLVTDTDTIGKTLEIISEYLENNCR